MHLDMIQHRRINLSKDFVEWVRDKFGEAVGLEDERLGIIDVESLEMAINDEPAIFAKYHHKDIRKFKGLLKRRKTSIGMFSITE